MAEGIAKCYHCGKGFCSAGSRDRHIITVHQNIRRFKCSVCEKTFTQKANCHSHEQNVHGKKKVHNSKIPHHKSRNHLSGFPVKSRLSVQPLKQSSKSRSTSRLGLSNPKNVAARTCDVCQRVFSFRHHMMNHRKGHFEKYGSVKNPKISRGHTEASLDTERLEECEIQRSERIESSPTKGSGRTCDICKQVFPYRFVMLRHRRGHFSEKDAEMGENMSKDKASSETQHKPNHSCDICQRVFSFKTSMVRHRKVHFQKDDGSKRRKIARGYMDKMANRNAKLKCDICDESFRFRVNMLNHRKLHFSNENNPAEDVDSAVDSANLNKEGESSTDKGAESNVGHDSHTETVKLRNKTKDVTSDICGKTYANPAKMRRHRNTHSKSIRKGLSDSKVENKSEAQHIMDEGEREKIDEMMKSTVGTECLICHAKFSRYWGLKVHVQAVHLKIRQFKCKFCTYSCSQKANLRMHVQRLHSSADKPFENGRRRNWHAAKGLKQIPDRQARTCPICFKIFSDRSNMYRHKKQMHGLEPKDPIRTRTCPICFKIFSDRFNMYRHKKQVHASEPKEPISSRTCPICFKIFTYRFNMYRHKKQVHASEPKEPIRGRTCPICFKIFINRFNMYRHKKQVHASEPKEPIRGRTCPICFKIFTASSNMYRHKKQVHASELEKPVRENELLQNISGTPDVIKASANPSEDPVLEDEAMPQLIKSNHIREDRILLSGPKQGESPRIRTHKQQRSKFPHVRKRYSHQEWTCDVCDKVFRYRSLMVRHRACHSSWKTNEMNKQVAEIDPPATQVETPLEGPTAMSQDERERIEEMLRSDYTGTTCTICFEDFNHLRSLILHINTVHLKLKPCIQESEPPTKRVPLKNIECEICGKMFFTNFSMLRHRKTHSSNEILPKGDPPNDDDEYNSGADTQAPFGCEEDERRMSDTSTRKYQCRKCNSSFPSRSLLVKHHYAYHVRKWRYDCSQCGKHFTRQHHLGSHMRKVHGTAPTVDDNTKVHGTAPTVDDNTKPDSGPGISDRGEELLHKNSTVAAPPNLPLYAINTGRTEVKTNSSTSSGPAVEIRKPRHRNSSGSSHSSWTPSVGSSPSVKSSHSSSSMYSARSSSALGALANMKVYKCTMCRHIFTNADDWREHLSQHLGGGTKIIYLGCDSDSVKCEDGEKPTGNMWSYTCPSCKVEVQGSFNLVMHIKQHMM